MQLRHLLFTGLLLLGTVLGIGCANSPTAPKIAALVLDVGGPDDRSFNQSAINGLKCAQQKLHLSPDSLKWVESHSPSDYQTNLTNMARQGYKVVFAVGYAMEDALKQVAPQFPNTKFAIIDDPGPHLPNCAGLVFKEQEGSFLAGFLAASVSRTKKIGFVGGQQIPLIEKFEAGYRAGAETADPSVKVTATYTGDWNDVLKGRSQAEQQFAAGDDIIYHAAGKAGLGVIEAAKARGPGYFAIGVDQDQDYLAPGRVLTSMVKHVDRAVCDTIQRVVANRFTPGEHIYGLKEGGVGLSEMRYTKQLIPPAVLKKLAIIQQMIIEGKIVPPTSLAQLKTFRPPHIP
ncbi:BMP family lipoprotein [Chthonomonas calidirosea]|uniref:BMP family lipoprotein n=1 Tax=Chthonomonas calidirosea TaxID=454171 RepID=UPI0006ECA027|nr:BMP family ABC transporter substrate-binding protein [Chthonomonas calidirosea]CEK14298.1 nucleoside-binding protein [Chthonomonas calidirosea]